MKAKRNKGFTVVNGYIHVRVGKDCHLADGKGYARRSRLVMEEKLGRRLLPVEVVHHCDGDKTNDAPDNLMLFASCAEHTRYHAMVPRLSATQQVIRALLRRHGPLTVRDILDRSELTKVKVENDLQQLKRRGCAGQASHARWVLSGAWAKRIIITATGPEYHYDT